MTRLMEMVIGNPSTLLWLVLAAFGIGLTAGAAPAWYVQGLRLESARSTLAAVRAEGEASAKIAATITETDRQKKGSSDRDYKQSLAVLTADIKRLRNSRASSNYVPAAPAGSGSPGVACFDRVELERALRRLDDGVSGILAEGDADTVALNSARRWASDTRGGTSRDSPATASP